MKKLVIGSLAGIGGLGIASFVGIALATRDAPPPPATAPAAGAAPPEPQVVLEAPVARAPGPAQGLGLPADAPQPAEPVEVAAAVPPPPPARDSWEAVPIVAGRRRIFGLDPEVIGPRLSACFSPDLASRRGGWISVVKDAAPLQDETMATLVLQIEVAGGELRVVDAPLESRGLATDGTVACAQEILRGQTGPARGIRDGRHRFRFPLVP